MTDQDARDAIDGVMDLMGKQTKAMQRMTAALEELAKRVQYLESKHDGR